MKLSTICNQACAGFLLAGLVIAAACAADAAPVSLGFVRSILNAAPSAVQQVLGKPDNGIRSTNDCTDAKMAICDHAAYKNGRYEAIYYKGKLKSLIIYDNDLFGRNAPEALGFPASPPTWENELNRSWRDAAHKGTAQGPLIGIEGIEEIDVYPPNHLNDNRGYMVINIDIASKRSFAR